MATLWDHTPPAIRCCGALDSLQPVLRWMSPVTETLTLIAPGGARTQVVAGLWRREP